MKRICLIRLRMTSVKDADQGGFMPSFYRVPGRASFSEFTRASSLKLVRTAATARELSRSRTACGGKYLTSCLTRMGGPEIDCTHAWHTATRPAITQVFAGLVILSSDSEISRRRASTRRRSGGSIRGSDIRASERCRSRSRGWSAADHGRAARAEPCRRPWKSSRSRASCR